MIYLKGNIVYTPKLGSLVIIKHGGILLKNDGTIVSILKKEPKIDKLEVIDCGDAFIMQSFCDMHLHAPQFPMLGLGGDLPLLDWLNTYTFKTEALFKDKHFARKAYKKLANLLITNGTTRVAMFSSLHTDSTIILMEELEKAGICGYVGKVNMDKDVPSYLSETTEESKNETLRFLALAKKFKKIKPILTPRFSLSCSKEILGWLGEEAKKENLYVQSHISENEDEIKLVKKIFKTDSYFKTYLEAGLWKDHTLMAHGVHCSPLERKAMRDYGIVLVTCPGSNANLNSGICPVRKYLNEGNWVTLGSDIAGGGILPMYSNIRMAICISKMQYLKSNKKDQFLSLKEGYYLASAASHKYFDDSSGFTPGKKLHAIIADDSNFITPKNLTLEKRFERLINLMNEKNIIAVFSDGKKVV